MMVNVNNIELSYPISLDDITLGQWIEFNIVYGQALDERLTAILEKPEGYRRELEVMDHHVDRAYETFSFFSGVDLIDAKQVYYLNDVVQLYNLHFANLFDAQVEMRGQYQFNGQDWYLQAPAPSPSSSITFGEFIDIKVITQAVNEEKQSKWQLLQYVCAIFLRMQDEQYNESMVEADSDRLQLMQQLPMSVAVEVLTFFEQFNAFCEQTFSVFHDSGMKGGNRAKLHFQKWGWVNFLKSIAKTKVFDIPNGGMNSIDCARHAKCYEVLIYASEEKDYNEALIQDMEAQYK